MTSRNIVFGLGVVGALVLFWLLFSAPLMHSAPPLAAHSTPAMLTWRAFGGQAFPPPLPTLTLTPARTVTPAPGPPVPPPSPTFAFAPP